MRREIIAACAGEFLRAFTFGLKLGIAAVIGAACGAVLLVTLNHFW